MAHEAIVSRNNDDTGSTTLLGGVVVQLAVPIQRKPISPINPPRAQTVPISELSTSSSVDSIKQAQLHSQLGKSTSFVDVKATTVPPFELSLPTPPIELPETTDAYRYAIVGISVGDCRGFLYSSRTQKVIDITQGNCHNLG